MELKVAKYLNVAEETTNKKKSIISGLEAALIRAKIGTDGEKGAAVTMKVVIRKNELKQVLELVKKSGAKKASHQTWRMPLPWSSAPAEQRLNLLWQRKFSKSGNAARGIGSHRCPWRPTLQNIPEE
ncbi:hypothetical protein CDL15_Pgr019728 [Punica granatum]|uniref:Uncharacterized protein n=1 Tax=Punica granatum TaxID=22663 RepID=A0A218X6Q8_PUNGR|nr:hypothetical protein CDL15_Pgr019728 [Punica granatum]PKI59822.1 hypothetical protein CRG98_019770 [Punica granatum]